MRKTSFIFGLHEIVFALFLVVNSIINRWVYGLLEQTFSANWLISVIDLVISLFYI